MEDEAVLVPHLTHGLVGGVVDEHHLVLLLLGLEQGQERQE